MKYMYIPIWTNDISHLGVIRSLGSNKEKFHSIKVTWPEMPITTSQTSKFMQDYTNIGNPFTDLESSKTKALDICNSLIRQGHQLAFIPTSDTAQNFLAELVKSLEEGSWDVIPHGQMGAYSNFFDKGYHETIFAKLKNVYAISDSVDSKYYPKVIKPAVKDLGNSFARNLGSKAIIVTNKKDLKKYIKSPELSQRMIFQKFLNWNEWKEIPCYFYFSNGKLKFSSAVQKHLIHPSPNGTAYLLEHIEVDPSLLEVAKDIGVKLVWTGPLMIEFAKHKQLKPAIIEINTRPWLLNEAFRQLGKDFILGTEIRPRDIKAQPWSLWLRGLCQITSTFKPHHLLEEYFETYATAFFYDADYLPNDTQPFYEGIKVYENQKNCRQIIDLTLKHIRL